MKTTYRKGSLGEAEAKEVKIAIIIFCIIFATVLLITLLPNSWYFHMYFLRAAWWWKVTGLILSAGWFLLVIFKLKDVETGRPFAILMFAAMALILAMLFGFDLSLTSAQ